MILKARDPITVLKVNFRPKGTKYKDRSGIEKEHARDMWECLVRFTDRAYSRVTQTNQEKSSEEFLQSEIEIKPGVYEAEIAVSTFEGSRDVQFRIAAVYPVRKLKE